jgi:hypothetical protein
MLGMVLHAYNLSYLEGRRRIINLSPAWAKLVRPYLKSKYKTKGLGLWLKR